MSDQEFVMSSRRPYLLRAVYEWILDNDCTPFVLVDAAVPGVEVPEHYAQDGKIVLNVSPSAVRGFIIDNERVEFSARFNGRALELAFPVAAVMAIYARENGEGMVLEPVLQAEVAEDGGDLSGSENSSSAGGPALVLVDDDSSDADSRGSDSPDADNTGGAANSSDDSTTDPDDPDDTPPAPPPNKGRPALRVVK